MRAIWIPRHGQADVLEVRETPDPELKAGHIKIRVRASGLNFAEISARQGLYPDAPKPPCIVGYEVSGTVEAIASDVTGWSIGQRVLALTQFGGHADVVVAPAKQVLLIPDEMSFEEGAALPVNYLTAYILLHRLGAMQPGDHVLIHGAGGGVGLAALQLCKGVKDITTYGTASSSKHAVLREFGCTHPIDYRNDDYVTEIRRLSNGEGVDIVLDALGGADWKKGYSLLKPLGRLCCFGFANMQKGESRHLIHAARQLLAMPRFSPLKLMDDNRMVGGLNVGHMWNHTELLQRDMRTLIELYRQGQIKPRVDKVFPFSEAAAAHRRISDRQNIGKVVLVP